MAKHRTHSVEFKRQIAEDFIAGETLHALGNRHDISRNLTRIWLRKFEAGAFDDDAQVAAVDGRELCFGHYAFLRNEGLALPTTFGRFLGPHPR